jgi:hypothetical protein
VPSSFRSTSQRGAVPALGGFCSAAEGTVRPVDVPDSWGSSEGSSPRWLSTGYRNVMRARLLTCFSPVHHGEWSWRRWLGQLRQSPVSVEREDRVARCFGHELVERRVGCDVERGAGDRGGRIQRSAPVLQQCLGACRSMCKRLGASGAADFRLAGGACVAHPADLAVGARRASARRIRSACPGLNRAGWSCGRGP